MHNSYGYGLFTGGMGYHYGAERLGCTVVPIAGGMTERQVQLIRDFEPRATLVTPSYFLSILDEMDRQGIDPRESSLRIGVFGAEPWTPAMREAVETRSSILAIDEYGLSEVIGPGVAGESAETKDGLNIWEDCFYPEIIDPITGEVLPDGSEGELVFTSLTKEAFPVIRYRTKDLSTDQFQEKLKAAIGERDSGVGSLGAGPLATGEQIASDPFARVSDNMNNILYHDDSNVGLEQQVAAITKNHMQHNLALTILNSQFRLLQTAVSERA